MPSVPPGFAFYTEFFHYEVPTHPLPNPHTCNGILPKFLPSYLKGLLAHAKPTSTGKKYLQSQTLGKILTKPLSLILKALN